MYFIHFTISHGTKILITTHFNFKKLYTIQLMQNNKYFIGVDISIVCYGMVYIYHW